jgi:hypothetical protein
MKMIVLSALGAIVLGLAAAALLNTRQVPAYEAFVTEGARVGDPGTNLVGPNWTGLNRDAPRQ